MRHLLLVIFVAATACTDPPTEATTAADVSWDCASVCFKGFPCHNFCKLTLDDPGFAVVPSQNTCDKLRPINVCGDTCCDAAEADRLNRDQWCPSDCKLARLEIATLDGRVRLLDDGRQLATVEPDHIAFDPVCR